MTCWITGHWPLDRGGSARLLDRLCRVHLAERWVAGDVALNHRTPADCRADHDKLLDGQPTRSNAALHAEATRALSTAAARRPVPLRTAALASA